VDTAASAAQGAGAGVSATPLVIIGGGEHARVVIDCARSQPERWSVVGYCDLAASDETTRRFGVPWLGDDDAVSSHVPAGAAYVIGMGALVPSPRRAELAARFVARQVRWASVVHARAVVSDSAAIADGVVICAGAIVNTGARIGPHAVVNSGAVVEHDVELGAFAIVAPGAVIGGLAVVGEGAFLGLGSRVRDHVRIGARALVGMGAAVVSDVDDDAVVVGVPARSRRP
jgi:acetyltransferase EpsM